jgi:hypothetical protein
MKATILAAAIVLGAIFNSADAQAIKQHGRHQQHRIKQGVHSGELTRRETRHLAKDERGIRHEVRDARSDGRVSRHERREIPHDQRQESRRIYRKKHNRRDRN